MSLSKMTLLDIPDLPMIKILEKCDFMSLICLRKTCHNLRNFIDYLAPETEVKSIEINVDFNKIRMHLYNLPKPSSILDVTYKKCSRGCELELFKNQLKKEWNNKKCKLINRTKVKKYTMDADFMAVFGMDLAVILRMQRTTLDSLIVSVKSTPEEEQKKIYKSTGLLSFLGCCCRSRRQTKAITEDLDSSINLLLMFNRVYDKIEISLPSRPLRVKRVFLSATGQRQIMQVLPYTDPNVLDLLQVRCSANEEDCGDPIELEIDYLVKLEHWRMIKELWTIGFKLESGLIENLTHFEKVQVIFDVVTANHFLFLKEKFLTTPNSLRFLLTYKDIENPDVFNETVGHPTYPDIDTWEIPIPGTNQYLNVKKFSNCLKFERRTYP